MEPILSIITLSPSTALLSKMLANMSALLKTGQEKSMQQFGLTSQVTEKKLSLQDAHTETLTIFFPNATVLFRRISTCSKSTFLPEIVMP